MYKHVIYIKIVGLRPLYNMNSINITQRIQKRKAEEWKRVQVRENEKWNLHHSDFKLSLRVWLENKKKTTLYRRWKDYTFPSLSRPWPIRAPEIFIVFGLFKYAFIGEGVLL